MCATSTVPVKKIIYAAFHMNFMYLYDFHNTPLVG